MTFFIRNFRFSYTKHTRNNRNIKGNFLIEATNVREKNPGNITLIVKVDKSYSLYHRLLC